MKDPSEFYCALYASPLHPYAQRCDEQCQSCQTWRGDREEPKEKDSEHHRSGERARSSWSPT
jgi:hypothetical protein